MPHIEYRVLVRKKTRHEGAIKQKGRDTHATRLHTSVLNYNYESEEGSGRAHRTAKEHSFLSAASRCSLLMTSRCGEMRRWMAIFVLFVAKAHAFSITASSSASSLGQRRRTVLLTAEKELNVMGEQLSMPARWKQVHDCERPARWRESMDEEDCKMYREELSAAGGTGMIADPPAGSRSYTDLIPSLLSVDDFLAANQRGAACNKLVVVKFYSNKCRACLRIATKYRRLALDYKEQMVCYEACLQDARSLLERLDVEAVPSVQIFDGEDVTRLATYSCHPKEWKHVDSKIRTAVKSMQKRRSLHKLFGEPLKDILTCPIL